MSLDPLNFITTTNLYYSTKVVDRERLEDFVPHLKVELSLHKASFNSREKITHFLCQIHHESGEYRYLEELASGEDYEFRADLGNRSPGDGRRYKGRGLIQLTGRANYGEFERDTGLPVLEKPTLLLQPKFAVKSAVWFWIKRGLPQLAEKGDFDAIVRRVNGGLNGYQDRLEYLRLAMNSYDRWHRGYRNG